MGSPALLLGRSWPIQAARINRSFSKSSLAQSWDARGLAQALLGLGRATQQAGAHDKAQVFFVEAVCRQRPSPGSQSTFEIFLAEF
jgi:hypothetical protein